MNKYQLALKLLFLIFSVCGYCATFDEKAAELGIKFQHSDGRSGAYQFTETAGSGLAWLDYNQDDFVDLLIINAVGGKHKLFKNTGKYFVDVSDDVFSHEKLSTHHRAMGVCSADVNQDGWPDFLITAAGQDKLYLNNKGKTFQTQVLDDSAAGLWSTSCAFADLDQDGDLDLYVSRYVKYDFNGNKSCQNTDIKGYCNPKAYAGQHDGLYLNDGHAQFTEMAAKRGIEMGNQDRGFGVVISDFDQDGDADIYVANDGSANRYYVNNGEGYFDDQALLLGAAINHHGKAEAGMGLALGDLNRDGFQDVVVSHFSLETNTIYLNHQAQYFLDASAKMGIVKASLLPMGWGMALSDVDNDGDEDLLVANGHIHHFIGELDGRQNYHQANQLFLNNGKGQLEIQATAKAFIVDQHRSSRGFGVADWNNDGQIDFAVNNINDRSTLYENSHNNDHQWLGIKLIGPKNNRSAIGAVVTVSSGDLLQRKEVISGGSFMSQSDVRLLFGLVNYSGAVRVQIKWPDAKLQTVNIDVLNQYHTIKQENQ